MSITILKPGHMSSVQDLGRWGSQQFGIPVGGAMDKVSASLANIICGNDEHEAVLELTWHGTEILFNEEAYCSFTGGGCKVFIDEVELPFNRLLRVSAGSILKTVFDASGCRAYLAVSSGFDIRKDMGSASTYTPSGIGGIQGRNLITGDLIPFKKSRHRMNTSSLKSVSKNCSYSSWEVHHVFPVQTALTTVHLLAGPEYNLFSTSSHEHLINSVFTISSKSNRMGYRLEGAKFTLQEKEEMVSTPVTSGIMQVTHEGDPIILMADAQTIGGYPRIARVCAADIPVLAQLRPGDKIQCKKIDEEESALRYYKQQEVLKKIKVGLRGNKAPL